ncbi:MAG: sulfatase-like hydrolase/transferase [Clostridia bacterium]|nr:sulfatase-like hydrolase/transferase [Clostridia bacterium]
MLKPNIIFYFSDQQRFDTLTPDLMPNLWALAEEGTRYTNSYTCQPVCGPARACLQTGKYATQCECFKNGIALPETEKTLADYFNENGYDTAYIGKWHLASGKKKHYEKTAVPKELQGGYKYWRASDVLEFTSHGYDGYVFDENGNKIDFIGYRADAINDFAIEYINNRSEENEKPFFMFVSQLEPHHQNDHKAFEGFKETVDNYKDYPLPEDLTFLKGDYKKAYPDYLSAINRIDYNLGKLIETLKENGLYDNTVIIYTSDHGCHFKTRNIEYKRSCHESSIHTPLVIGGGAFKRGTVDDRLVSLIDLPPTLLDFADIYIPSFFSGISILEQEKNGTERENVFIQISESQVGRAIRTKKYKYSVRAFGNGFAKKDSKVYYEDYLYDLENDPYEKMNLANDKNFKEIRKNLAKQLSDEMEKAWELKPKIKPALIKRKK